MPGSSACGDTPLQRLMLAGAMLAMWLFCAAASAQTLRVGVYQNQPKVFIDEQGKPRGLLIDYLDYIAKQHGWNLDYVPCKWSECLDMLQEGQLDLMPDVARTPGREQRFSFHKVPALYSWLQVYYKSGLGVSSVLDLNGKRVATLADSVQAQTIQSLESGFGIKVTLVEADSFDTAFRDVADGKADAVMVNNFFGDYHMAEYGLRRTSIMFHPSQLYYATQKGHHLDVLAGIDASLSRMKADTNSIYYTARTKWIGEPPREFIPLYVWWIGGLILALFVIASGVALLLRWQVRVKMRDLQQQNEHLEQVLQELDKTRERVNAQERLYILGQMFSGIAHDFNNNLMLILGHSQILHRAMQDGNFSRDDFTSQLEIIEQAGLDAGAIVGRMREFYRPDREEAVEAVQLEDVIEDIIVLTKPRWRSPGPGARPIEIQRELGKVPPVMATRHEVREALLNLVLNAVDAMQDGGILTVRTRCAGQEVLVQIEDTGCGMSQEVAQACMRPFFTTKEQTGTGLGLSMAASIVKRYGGSIDVHSVEGEGTTFTLTFPLERHGPTVEQQASPDEAPVASRSVLLVEDNPDLLAMMTSMLTTDGHTVHGSESPLDAMTIAAEKQFDIALFDQTMPEMTGTELLETLRARGFEAPVIIITGLTDLRDIERAHPDGILTKPVTLKQLRKTLAELEDRGAPA